MVSRAIAKYVRVSPRKVRAVIKVIKGKNTRKALEILANLNKAASIHVEKVLQSAVSNAKKNASINAESLYISKITVDDGPILKRYRAAAMGRAVPVRKRTSHIQVELDSEI